jgi:transposase
MASAKADQVEPFAYVRDLLGKFSAERPDDLSALLPDQWLKTHPESQRHWSR